MKLRRSYGDTVVAELSPEDLDHIPGVLALVPRVAKRMKVLGRHDFATFAAVVRAPVSEHNTMSSKCGEDTVKIRAAALEWGFIDGHERRVPGVAEAQSSPRADISPRI